MRTSSASKQLTSPYTALRVLAVEVTFRFRTAIFLPVMLILRLSFHAGSLSLCSNRIVPLPSSVRPVPASLMSPVKK